MPQRPGGADSNARAPQDTTAAETAALQGRLASAMTGSPLAEATVRIEVASRGAITDSAGRFAISGRPAGEALVSVRHPRRPTLGRPGAAG